MMKPFIAIKIHVYVCAVGICSRREEEMFGFEFYHKNKQQIH